MGTIKDEERAAALVSRRRVLKGGAIAGTAAWAVPAVQVIGLGSAHAQQASPPPPPPPPSNGECTDISNIQIIVSSGGVLYGLKFDPGDSDPWNAWSSAAPDSNDCIRYFESSTSQTVVTDDDVAHDFNDGAQVMIIDDCEWRLNLPLPDGYEFVAGYIKSGNVSDTECPTAAAPGATYVAFLNS